MEFDWDTGNLYKLMVINAYRGIGKEEIESVFDDPGRTESKNKYPKEERFETIGLSNQNRIILVIFTKRNGKIRYITAWQQSSPY